MTNKLGAFEVMRISIQTRRRFTKSLAVGVDHNRVFSSWVSSMLFTHVFIA
jgi:hypothetical protein